MDSAGPGATDRFVNSAQLRELLGVSDSTLRLWRKRGLPHVGGVMTRPRYAVPRVLEWLNQARRGA